MAMISEYEIPMLQESYDSGGIPGEERTDENSCNVTGLDSGADPAFITERQVVSGGTALKLLAGATFSCPVYSGNGGAFCVESGGTVTGGNVVFMNNGVTDSGGQGGAIYNGSGAVLNVSSATFSCNSANTTDSKGQGGAIFNGGSATITDTTLSGNRATMGGAVFNNGGRLEISGGTVCGNRAKYGGAIQNFGRGAVVNNIVSTVFSGNSAAADGGAIVHYAGTATIIGASFCDNRARGGGGAIYNANELTLAGVTFSGNSANSGGAVYNTKGGTVNLCGTADLQTKTDTWVNQGYYNAEKGTKSSATVNWDLSQVTDPAKSTVCIRNFQYYCNLETNVGTEEAPVMEFLVNQTITVNAEDVDGNKYVIATGNFDNVANKDTFTLTGGSGADATITINGESVTYNDKTYTLAVNDNGTKEDTSDDNLVLIVGAGSVPTDLSGSAKGISWEGDCTSYVAEYTQDSYATGLRIQTANSAVDTYGMPGGEYDWRVRYQSEEQWAEGSKITAAKASSPEELVSDADGIGDLFFGRTGEVWTDDYVAQHLGLKGGWSGTEETVALSGKNRIADVFAGSKDANLLVLTDDGNGDALFVDDIYSAFPESQKQARLAQLDEIWAGAGDDVIDMTSQEFTYDGDGLTLRGGSGDDTLWSNKGDNFLFGDAGNDRLAGASGNDVLAGGAGDDSMQGGGGNDIFTFGANWGNDTIEQLDDGSITLWFAEEFGLTFKAEGDNTKITSAQGTILVKGLSVAKTKDCCRYGSTGYEERYSELVELGAFAESSTSSIFDEEGEGRLAML